MAQTRSLSFGSLKTCAPLQPCCFRFSAPLVEKVFQKRSKSPIFAVARTIVSSFVGTCCARAPYATSSREMERRSHPASRRVRRSASRARRRPQVRGVAGPSRLSLRALRGADRAQGCARRVPVQIGDAWDEVLTADRPAVLEAVTDPEVPPFAAAHHFRAGEALPPLRRQATAAG